MPGGRLFSDTFVAPSLFLQQAFAALAYRAMQRRPCVFELCMLACRAHAVSEYSYAVRGTVVFPCGFSIITKKIKS